MASSSSREEGSSIPSAKGCGLLVQLSHRSQRATSGSRITNKCCGEESLQAQDEVNGAYLPGRQLCQVVGMKLPTMVLPNVIMQW